MTELAFFRNEHETDAELAERVNLASKLFFRKRAIKAGTKDPEAVARGFTLEMRDTPAGKQYKYIHDNATH